MHISLLFEIETRKKTQARTTDCIKVLSVEKKIFDFDLKVSEFVSIRDLKYIHNQYRLVNFLQMSSLDMGYYLSFKK